MPAGPPFASHPALPNLFTLRRSPGVGVGQGGCAGQGEKLPRPRSFPGRHLLLAVFEMSFDLIISISQSKTLQMVMDSKYTPRNAGLTRGLVFFLKSRLYSHIMENVSLG